ncbi:MAG TPA: hypothetical protein VFQ59_03250 [Candidatus Paceibacterota bacterium]|nr:hypothetical protein [Candidatus Paceibacterota bacterium]
MIRDHFSKANLHHAYLIEGSREEILVEVSEALEELGIPCHGNPDFCHISLDGFKIEDAFSLREMVSRKSFTEDVGENAGKKLFVVSVNSITREAQGVLLKIFEEPSAGTHFFMITPDVSAILPTLRSRFYYISATTKSDLGDAEKFLKMNKALRIDFLKEFLKDDEEDGTDSARARAKQLINDLETILAQKLDTKDVEYFKQIFRVREFLRQPGSSVKTLMESLALVIPVLQ